MEIVLIKSSAELPAAMFKNNEAIERSYERMREEIKRVESSGLEIDVKKLVQEELAQEMSRARKLIDKEVEQARAAGEAALSKVERQCLREKSDISFSVRR